jgi:hypothetical protein
MKSMGCLAALLKDIMEFSLIAFILRSVDCKIFIPFPLCPNTKNFGVLNAASLFNSTPAKKKPKTHIKKVQESIKKALLLAIYLWRNELSREKERHSQGRGQD